MSLSGVVSSADTWTAVGSMVKVLARKRVTSQCQRTLRFLLRPLTAAPDSLVSYSFQVSEMSPRAAAWHSAPPMSQAWNR